MRERHMRRTAAVLGTSLYLLPMTVSAQEAAGFTVLRHGDTVAVERFAREPYSLAGSLVRTAPGDIRERLHYRVTLLEDGTAPLLDLSAWRADDPEDAPARQTSRVIFKEDSVAIDVVTRSSGLRTLIFPTAVAAVPYLNLSVAFLEQATRRAAAAHGDSLAVAFFNLGGGQTASGAVRRLAPDSAVVQIGTVEFRLRVDAVGRILGGGLPAQDLVISRDPSP